MSIFDKRVNYKPFEYPGIYQFTDAINKSFWVHSEVDFTADTQDFHSHLTKEEQIAIKHSLLAIAQIEVAVKTFWGNLYQHFPKPEFNGLGSTFAECEFRHSEAYSRLLDVLGYNDEFEDLLTIPVIRERVEYLGKVLENSNNNTDRKKYVVSLILFSLLIENVSLFSQFAIILSFTRFKGLMKNVSNIIAWTSIDEQVHANAGIYIINIIRKEFPDFFDEELIAHVNDVIHNSIEIESKILDWIFETGDIESVNKHDLLNFMKFRVDESMVKIGLDKVFNITAEQYKPMQWFEEDVFANTLDDFFAKRPVDYTKHDKSFTADDLF
ncbi:MULTISPECIES: ribonucleotide-diphosphate reductase subunit beta [Myroides]|uniref:ribonucleoside-diphosphate reductase n=1 Tax=Myroides albus TaxID=2562892 RepID=A0A6I3LMR1_9FLAO|nr:MULTISPECIES: ribonucleotide-diphosphate reductase subunit beta [Myroides]MTG97881.1 ribonucleotide reductase [Myroides albus]MVX35281.1 ribonucleotide reductase [Myroides sp. LoEW2-1]UVD81068.1 ribonucleotide-diphosphate reductase subunit beta [Myroides albus]